MWLCKISEEAGMMESGDVDRVGLSLSAAEFPRRLDICRSCRHEPGVDPQPRPFSNAILGCDGAVDTTTSGRVTD